MRQNSVVLSPGVFPMHLPCTNGVDPQVRGFLIVQRTRVDSRERRRIYAVTLKSIPIVLGFAGITASQLVLGIYTIVVAARSGGKGYLN